MRTILFKDFMMNMKFRIGGIRIMRVFIHAYEGQYCGLHGIEDLTCTEVNSVEEAYEIGKEMSEEVISSFGLEDEWLAEEDESEDCTDYGTYAEFYGLEYEIYKIKDEVHLSIEELDALCFQYGKDLFINEYCEPQAL
jgi:hypothetical protein